MERYKNEKYRKWLARYPCIICGDDTTTEACHVRYAFAAIGKASGIGKKPHDYYCVPMCGKHHRLQHSGNEFGFWTDRGGDPIPVALLLFAIYITTECYGAGLAVCQSFRRSLSQ